MFEGSFAEKLRFFEFRSFSFEGSLAEKLRFRASKLHVIYLSIFLSYLSISLSLSLSLFLSRYLSISTSKSRPNMVCFVHVDSLSLFLSLYLSISLSQLLKAVRTWCVLCMLTSKWTSRHNGVKFCISHLGSWLRARRCSELTCRLSGATKHWKNMEKLYLLAPLHLLSSDSFEVEWRPWFGGTQGGS